METCVRKSTVSSIYHGRENLLPLSCPLARLLILVSARKTLSPLARLDPHSHAGRKTYFSPLVQSIILFITGARFLSSKLHRPDPSSAERWYEHSERARSEFFLLAPQRTAKNELKREIPAWCKTYDLLACLQCFFWQKKLMSHISRIIFYFMNHAIENSLEFVKKTISTSHILAAWLPE